jgi:hypothetical protein
MFNKTNEEIEKMLGFPTGLDESFAEEVKTIITKLQRSTNKEQLFAVYKYLKKLIDR